MGAADAVGPVQCLCCGVWMRPEGAAPELFPGMVPAWGDWQCQRCDYVSASKDPENRFLHVDRLAQLNGLRASLAHDRHLRQIPPAGQLPAGRVSIAELIAAIELGEAS